MGLQSILEQLHSFQQESPPVWMQEAYRPRHIKYSICFLRWGTLPPWLDLARVLPLWTERWMDGQTRVKTLPSRRTTYAVSNERYLQVSSQHWFCVDADAWCKRALILIIIVLIFETVRRCLQYLKDLMGYSESQMHRTQDPVENKRVNFLWWTTRVWSADTTAVLK